MTSAKDYSARVRIATSCPSLSATGLAFMEEACLAAVIAALCFIACLAAVGAAAGERAAHGWAGRLRAEATVQVRPRVNETGAAAAGRAAETLAGVKGVQEAEAMDRATAERLLRPWVGEAALAV